MLHRGRPLAEGGVHVGLQQGRSAPAVAGIGGDDEAGLGVVAAVDDGIGGEAAKDHRVGHADTGAGQHGHRQFGDHRHVDGHPIARAQPEALEHIGELGDLGQQVGVGDGEGVARLTLPAEGDLVALSCFNMAVEAVVRHVEGAADEPPGKGQIPLQDGVEVGVPVQQLAGLSGPERLEIGLGLVVERAVVGQCGGGEIGGRGEGALLDVIVLDGGVGHSRSFPMLSRNSAASLHSVALQRIWSSGADFLGWELIEGHGYPGCDTV